MAAQSDTYVIRKAPFSSTRFDEFSPVFYKGGIVFCSNRGSGVFTGFSSAENKHFFKMFHADTSAKVSPEAVALPGKVNSPLNNGPATFNRTGDTVYFSRNLIVEGSFREISGEENKLGLFFAVLRNGEWTDVQELRFNDYSWNVTTPFLSPDGRRLYFASDKPDGMGGSDLYYSEWKNSYWGNPVNLGETINSEGNEAYPFINGNGDLFFSSDGHKGRGGKDIFYTRYADSAWITPVPLDPPINSSADDFGLVADDINHTGWFSSNRDNMLDIYKFTTINPQFFYCEEQKDNNFCFTFADDGLIDIDPISLQFRWNFGDGKPQTGYLASYCFPGPGTYEIKQDVVDRKTGRVIYNKLFIRAEIIDPGKPRIKSDDFAAPGKNILLEGEEVKGHQVLGYYWNPEGKRIVRGNSVQYTFSDPGEYRVRMLTNMKETATGRLKQFCVTKTINVGQSAAGMSVPGPGKEIQPAAVDGFTWLKDSRNANVETVYSAADDLLARSVFAVELMSSPKRLRVNDQVLGKMGPDYDVKTIRTGRDSTYSYIIDEQLTFMAAIPALRKALASGYPDARIRTYVPDNPGEVELWNFRRTNPTGSQLLFVNNGTTISQDGIPVLDRLMLLLRRNPGMSLTVAVHTENGNSSWTNLQLSRRQAQSIVDYLAGMGIDRSRLEAVGYGGSKPVYPDYPESEKLKNRRVEFIAKRSGTE